MVEIQKDEDRRRIFGGLALLLAVRIARGRRPALMVAQDVSRIGLSLAHLLAATPPLAQPRRRLNKRLERVRKD